MSKTRDTGFLGNVVKYDANGNVTVVNGATTLLSVSSSGQLTVPGDEVITGSLTVLGGITGAITGSATSASYAANTSLLNGSGSGEFVPTGSFNTFSSSILTYTGSANSRLGSLETTSGSNITRLNALEVTSGSNITRISALETASGSAITRLNSIESKTGSYATTGSNTFDGGAYFSSSFNPTGFSTTASLYTDGGLRVTRDAYISGTLYLNNLTVFGTQSVAYISSSQLNIGTNLITVNTDTPSIRFGGLAVYDSGSTGLTGSILWDSETNHWVYSNPSGSTYSGGMFISGPRTSTLGSETGTTSCMLLAGQGGDHLTSSLIYHSSTVTCIPNTLAGGVGCFSGAICAPSFVGGTVSGTTGTFTGTVIAGNGSSQTEIRINSSGGNNEGPFLRLQKGGANIAYVGAYSSIVSGTSNDLTYYAVCSQQWMTNNNTSTKMLLDGSGNLAINGERLAIGGTANNAIINNIASVRINIDSDNNNVGESFMVGHNQEGIDNNNVLFKVQDDGRVGIGTTSPNFKTHISTGDATSVTQPTAGTYGLYIQQNTSGNVGGIYIQDGASNSGNAIFVGDNNGAARFVVNTDGNVGIGTNTPGYALEICSNVADWASRIYNSNGAGNGLLVRTNNTCTNTVAFGVYNGTQYTVAVLGSGVTNFACQVCVKEAVYVYGSFPGVKLDRAGTTAQSDINWKDAGTSVWSIGTAVQAIGSNLDFYNYTLGGNVLKLTTTGEACFKYTVCAPRFSGTFYGTHYGFSKISNTSCLLSSASSDVTIYFTSGFNIYYGVNDYTVAAYQDDNAAIFSSLRALIPYNYYQSTSTTTNLASYVDGPNSHSALAVAICKIVNSNTYCIAVRFAKSSGNVTGVRIALTTNGIQPGDS